MMLDDTLCDALAVIHIANDLVVAVVNDGTERQNIRNNCCHHEERAVFGCDGGKFTICLCR